MLIVYLTEIIGSQYWEKNDINFKNCTTALQIACMKFFASIMRMVLLQCNY